MILVSSTDSSVLNSQLGFVLMLFLNSNFKIFEPFQYFFKGINFFLEFIIAISICYAVPSKLCIVVVNYHCIYLQG